MKKFVIILFAAALAMACSKSEYGPDVTLSLFPEKVGDFPSVAYTQQVQVNSSHYWYFSVLAKDGGSWCTATADGDVLTILVEDNGNDDRRKATVTVMCGELKRKIEVVQQGAALSIMPDALEEFPWEGASQSLEVTTNKPEWTAVVDDANKDWCTLARNNNILTVSVTKNPEPDNRRALVTLSAGDAVTEVEVTQQHGEVTLSVVSDPLSAFPAQARKEVKTMTISTNYPDYWTVEAKDEDWCKVTKRSNSTFSIALGDNVLQKERNTKVTVRCGAKSVEVPVKQMGLNISFPELDTYVQEKLLGEWQLPAVTVAVVWKERLVYAKAYGYKEKDGSDPAKWVLADNNTLFRQASNSKPITYATICYLVDKGKLDYGDRVFGEGGILGNDFGVPPVAANPALDIRNITVRDLIRHESGGWDNSGTYTSVVGEIGNQDPIFYYGKNYSTSYVVTNVIKDFPLGATPGSKSAYSNFGYCVLGRVIEKVTGQPYETYVRENILKPCGITAMYTSGTTFAERRENEAIFYEPNSSSRYWMYEAYDYKRQDASGAWTASAIDMMRFMTHVDRGTRVKDIISESAMSVYYMRYVSWNHAGSLPGTSTYMSRVNDDLSFTILTSMRWGGTNTFTTDFYGVKDIISQKTDWADDVDLF